jgi:hypothetical protein
LKCLLAVTKQRMFACFFSRSLHSSGSTRYNTKKWKWGVCSSRTN